MVCPCRVPSEDAATQGVAGEIWSSLYYRREKQRERD